MSREIEWANRLNKSVFIAVETVPLPEVHTTFYQEGTDRMNEQLEIVNKHFQGEPSYQGIAVHHLMNWRSMKVKKIED